MSSVLLTFVLTALFFIAFGQEKTCPPTTLCFAIDESGSISKKDFRIAKRIVIRVARKFARRTQNSTFGAVFFNQKAFLKAPFTQDIANFTENINAKKQRGKQTKIDEGLIKCFRKLRRVENPRIITLITDGDSDNRDAKKAAIKIKNEGIYITTIGVGKANKKLLRKIASNPEYFVYTQEYKELIDKIVNIVDGLCEVVQPTETVGCCGKTSTEADKCYIHCNTATDCPRAQKCYQTVNPPSYKNQCCGDTLREAADSCPSNCFETSDCTGDRWCYGIPFGLTGTGLVAKKEPGCCGETATEAEQCFVQCKTSNDCPRSQKCYDNPDPPKFEKTCCGTNGFSAANGCTQADCFFNSDCRGNEWCYGIPKGLGNDSEDPELEPGCCGRTGIDATQCFLQCLTDSDCPRSEECFNHPNPPNYEKKCCGTTVFSASSSCSKSDCLINSDCSGDEWCYGIPSSTRMLNEVKSFSPLEPRLKRVI